MPIHDWSRVEANVFHHFHQAWTITICNTLNAGLLPKGYSALVEQHAAGVVPDVVALQRRSGPTRPPQPVGGEVVTAEPRTRHVIRAQQTASARRGNRIVIRHALGRVVSVIEVVSPGNKGSRSALRSFVEKTVEFLRQGVHVLVVDLLPPSARDPAGIHKAIWDEIEEEPFELPPDKPLVLAAYVADDPVTAYVEPVGVGDQLPDMPAYLNPGAHVPVPLETTYRRPGRPVRRTCGMWSRRGCRCPTTARPSDFRRTRREARPRYRLLPGGRNTEAGCLHCQEVYDSYRIEWREGTDPDGKPWGFWCCPIPGCDGKGFGFDIYPTDPDYWDEDARPVFTYDEDDGEFDADLDLPRPRADRLPAGDDEIPF